MSCRIGIMQIIFPFLTSFHLPYAKIDHSVVAPYVDIVPDTHASMFHLFTNHSGPYIVRIERQFRHINTAIRKLHEISPICFLHLWELRAAHVFNLLNLLDARSAWSNEVVFGEPKSDEPYPGDRVVLLANFWHPNFGNSDETIVYSIVLVTACNLYVVLVFDSELEYGQGMLGVLGVLNKLQYLRLFIILRLFGFGGLWTCDFDVFSAVLRFLGPTDHILGRRLVISFSELI